MSDRQAVYWDCDPKKERLSSGSIDEAVLAWADQFDGPLPETVNVYGYARMEIDASQLAARVLDDVLDRLDQEHSDPEVITKPTKATDAMRAAGLAFADVIRREYVPWMCEQVETRVVNVIDYVPPEWLLK